MNSRMLFYVFVAAFTVFHSSSCTKENEIAALRKLTTEYNILSGPSLDVLAQLKMISEKSKIWLKLTGPAGSFLAACIETALPPESEMLKALTNFHIWVDRKFAEQNNVIERAMSSIRLANDLNDFDNNVDIPLSLLSNAVDLITDQRFVRSAKQEFIRACTNDCLSPQKILEYMNRKVNKNCQIMPRRISPIVTNVKALFDRIFSRFSEQKFTTEYDEFRTVYLQVVEKFSKFSEEKEALEAFVKIRDFTEESAFDETLNLLHLKDNLLDLFNETLPENCFLRGVYDGYESRRDSILAMAEIVKINTLKSTLIGGLCANISFAGNKERINKELEKLTAYSAEITGNVSEWISNELDSAWPMELERFSKSALGLEEITDPYAYNKTANLINREVSSRGTSNIVYNILVTKDWDRMENIWSRCPPECCHRVRAYHGVNFFIFRHEVENKERAQEAKKWFSNCQNNITEIIRSNDKTDELGTLTKLIENQIGPMTSGPLYHSFVFLHLSTFSKTNCKIPVGLSTIAYLGQTGFSFLEVNDHHWAPKNEECFKILFFI